MEKVVTVGGTTGSALGTDLASRRDKGGQGLSLYEKGTIHD